MTTEKKAMERKVSAIMHKLFIPANISGFFYLREGIILAIEEPKNIFKITKTIYPTIAVEFQTTSSRVERAIRHSIERSWGEPKSHKTYQELGYLNNSKPKTAELIALIIYYIIIIG